MSRAMWPAHCHHPDDKAASHLGTLASGAPARCSCSSPSRRWSGGGGGLPQSRGAIIPAGAPSSAACAPAEWRCPPLGWRSRGAPALAQPSQRRGSARLRLLAALAIVAARRAAQGRCSLPAQLLLAPSRRHGDEGHHAQRHHPGSWQRTTQHTRLNMCLRLLLLLAFLAL